MTTAAQIEALHSAYCDAMNCELKLNDCFVRWYFEALKLGLTVAHIEICVASRLKFNREHPGHKKGLELKHLIRSEDDVAVVLNEVAVVLASRRVKLYPPNKAQALRDAGLPDAPPQGGGEHVKVHIKNYIEQLKKAVE